MPPCHGGCWGRICRSLAGHITLPCYNLTALLSNTFLAVVAKRNLSLIYP